MPAGVAMFDYDGDGFLDLYFVNGAKLDDPMPPGQAPAKSAPRFWTRPYHNNGDGTFTDVTEKAGLRGHSYGMGVATGDYNNDGHVDVYVTNFGRNILYRNNGDGTFTDVTKEMGLWKPDGRAMSVTAADFKNDGKLELLSTNDAMENYYFELNSKGVYEEKAIEMNIAYSENGQGVAHMGPVVGDIDRDGFLDVFIPDLNYCSLLMQRRDGKGFEYRTNKAGLAVTMGQYAGWAAMMFDYDLDGWLDIFTVHGNAHHEYAQENTIVRNRGNGTFEDVSDTAGPHFKEKHVGRGGTGIDFNNDGKMDLVIVNVNDNAILLRNDTRTKNHWITVRPRLKFSTGTRDAYGARVTVKANGLTMIEDMIPTRGYLSAQDPRLNFGLGKADHADAIEIRWPGGALEQHTNVKADQFVTYTHEATATKVGAAKVQK